MASVLVQIDGVFWDDAEKKGTKGTMYGQMFRPDLGVGGGPIYPPDKPPGQPPTIWPNPPEGIAPHPEHPIMLPGMPGWPDVPPDMPKPPDAFTWHVAWTPNTGWVVVAVPNFDHPVPSAK